MYYISKDIVSEKHIGFESGRWKYVRDIDSSKIKHEQTHELYNLYTSNNLISGYLDLLQNCHIIFIHWKSNFEPYIWYYNLLLSGECVMMPAFNLPSYKQARLIAAIKSDLSR